MDHATATAINSYRGAVKLGVLCLEESKTIEAKEHFVRGTALCVALLDKTPHLYTVLYHLALGQLGSQQPDAALATYRGALNVCSLKGAVLFALLDLQLLKRSSQAIARLDEAIRLLEPALHEKV